MADITYRSPAVRHAARSHTGEQVGSPDAPSHAGADSETVPFVRLAVDAVTPRLFLTRPLPLPSETLSMSPSATAALSAEIDRFAAALVAPDAEDATRLIAEASALSWPQLTLSLLAPTAERLGAWWSEDRCDFTTVTLGMNRLHRLVLEQSAVEPSPDTRSNTHRCLLSLMPGEQHTFGQLLISDFLQRDGWDVHCIQPDTRRSLLASARDTWFAVIGLTVTRTSTLDDLAMTIHELRRVSANRKVGIIVGGAALQDEPEAIARRVGADATACDAQQAVKQINALFDLLPPAPPSAA